MYLVLNRKLDKRNKNKQVKSKDSEWQDIVVFSITVYFTKNYFIVYKTSRQMEELRKEKKKRSDSQFELVENISLATGESGNPLIKTLT